ncbi:uncharacterized protein [Venturia canescens]|uniref:uncharacterized protein n=1 Tax=Venturia canescens TaxID=32260 RepID=UPI001C9C9A5B|nr:uncharacterized protein LOC122415282 [Venturia canescens]
MNNAPGTSQFVRVLSEFSLTTEPGVIPLSEAPKTTKKGDRSVHVKPVKPALAPSREKYKFRPEWRKLPDMKRWLTQTKDPSRAFCKYCKVELVALLNNLRIHAKSDKHRNAADKYLPASRKRAVNKSEAVSTVTKQREKQHRQPDEREQPAPSRLAYAAMLEANAVFDYPSRLQRNTSSEASVDEIERTNQITSLGSHYFESLVKDIGDSYYSLLLDESPDITVNKILGIAIRYYSASSMRIVSAYLGLTKIEDATVADIVGAIKKMLHRAHLKLENLQGIGLDNASTMVEINLNIHGVLKLDVPHLKLFSCLCHSLQLAVSEASLNTLPNNIEFMIRETYNWFAHSSTRRLKYSELYDAINGEEDPVKIPQATGIRWLSIDTVVERILAQWQRLECHFETSRSKHSCLTADVLYKIYQDKSYFVYLKFLQPILGSVQETSRNFESKTADPTKLLSDLKMLYASIANRVVQSTALISTNERNNRGHLNLSSAMASALDTACSEHGIHGEAKASLKSRCVSFLVNLKKELEKRLPPDFEMLEKMNLFSVSECLKSDRMPITDVASYFEKNSAPSTLSRIESEWDKLRAINWKETTDTEKFWIEVVKYRDSSGEQQPFKLLSNLAFKILCLPHSNAHVERIFSQIDRIKSELPNETDLALFDSVLHVRFGLERIGAPNKHGAFDIFESTIALWNFLRAKN